MGKMFDFLVKEFDISPLKSELTVIDTFKLYRSMERYQSSLKRFEDENRDTLTPLERYVLMMETDPLKCYAYIFAQNHHVNYFEDYYLVLSNPVLTKSRLFDILYQNREMIKEVALHIKDIWGIIITEKYDGVELKKYYNQKMIDMFLNNLEFKKIDGMGDKYDDLWKNYFIPATQSVKRFIKQIRHLFSGDDNHSVPGLSNFNPELYRYMFKQNVGLDLDPDPAIMVNHAYQILEKNMRDCVDIGKKLYGKIIPYDALYTTLLNEPDQMFTSDEDMIQMYESCMAMYKKIYVDQQGFPVKTDVKLFSFNNPSLAGGMYQQGIFYLNLADSSTVRRYDVESLVLHETIPGHHLQVDISTYSPYVDPLTFVYGTMMNGFCEGWGLVAESMYDRSSLTPRQSILNEYGRLQMNNLRTYRIIADIKLHVYGVDADTIKTEMKKYVKTSDITINSEVYRYIAVPGQAPCYKLGEMILGKIDRSKYKELMIKGWLPLCFIEI